jgi:putative ABC transport system permease protein
MKAILASRWRSAWSRRGTLALVAAVGGAVHLLLLGVERLRSDVRENFSQSVSGTDLIVGARGGRCSCCCMPCSASAAPPTTCAWTAWKPSPAPRRGLDGAAVAGRFAPRLSGAGHHAGLLRAFPLRRQAAAGAGPGPAFSGDLPGLYEVVLGAEVAERLGYRLGDPLTLSHGGGGCPVPNMPTSPSAWSASCSAPARRWTARCTSACRRWRRSTWTGWPACRCRGRGSRPNRRAPPTCNPSR